MTPDTLAALHAAAFITERPWSADEFHALIANPLTHLCHAPDGFALWRGVAGEAELLTIAVHPKRQGQGVGKDLMARWMAEAAQTCDTAFLEVASDNAAAIALYGRYGFEIAAKRAGYYRRAQGRADALILRASLPFAGLENPLQRGR